MKKDLYNLPVSTLSASVIDALNHFHRELLMVGKGAGKILDAAKEHPESFLIQCYAAAVLLYAQENSVNAKALPYLTRAKAMLREVSRREQLIFQAIYSWYKIDYAKALQVFNEITNEWPSDCTSCKMAEWIYYCSGQVYNAKPFLAMCKTMHPSCKEQAGFLAIHSFALELNGRYQEAMDMALQALTLNPNTPWAHHTVGHVTLNASKIQEGIALYRHYAPVWENILPLLRGHLYWHSALYHVANRDEKEANHCYQGGMWGGNPDTVLEQIDAISYLWRMDMAGMPQDKKLTDLITHIGHHPFEFYMPFSNAHYIYAFSRLGNHTAVDQMLKSTENHAAKLKGAEHHLWKEITIPLLRGTAAYGKGNFKEASLQLAPIIQQVTQVGGSDAQDELFFQTYLVSLIKSGQADAAHTIMQDHLAHYQTTALGEYWKELETAR